jgi:hypothetical protein
VRRLGLAVLLGLVFAGSAGGRATAVRPAQLFVWTLNTTPGAAAETDVELSIPDSSPIAPISVSVYLPAGYGVATDRPPGTVVGAARVLRDDRREEASATLVSGDPVGHVTDACAPGTHAAVWTASLTVAGVALPLTVFVDATAGDEAARGAFKLVYCLPAPSDTTPRIVDIELDLHNALTNPAAGGLFTWRALVTPLEGAAFEVRSLVALPQLVTLRATYAARAGQLALTGRVVANGTPRSRINVHLDVAARPDFSGYTEAIVRTRADGSYVLVRRISPGKRKQELYLLAYVNFYVGDCTGPPLLAGGCAEQSIAPPPATFASVTIPRR